jgi:hypothetical protein
MVRLGFSVDPKGLEGFANNVEGIKKKMEGLKHLGEAYLGFEGLKKVGEFVKSAITGMADIQEFSERVDLAATDVAALGRVARENGSSLEGMEGTIASLNATLGKAASGFPRAEKMLSRFGLKAKDAHGQIKTFDQLLGEVATKMETASTGKRLAMANALGIDPKLIPLLREGGANFARLREEAMKAGSFKDSDYERAHESEKLFTKAEGAFLRLKQRLAIGLLPTVNEMLKKFTAWVSDSKNIAKIQGYIDSVVKVAKLLWENAGKIATVFGVLMAHKYGMMFLDWGEKIANVAKGLKNAGGMSDVLKRGFIGIKGILTGGLLGLFGLLIEDLLTYEKGGRSVTGWMMNQFPAGVEVMKLAIAGIGTAALALITGSGPLAIIIVGFAAWILAIKEIKNNWQLLMDEIERGIKRISDNKLGRALVYSGRVANFVTNPIGGVANALGMVGGADSSGGAVTSGAADSSGGAVTSGAADSSGGAVTSGAADWQAPGAGVFADFGRKPEWRMDRVSSSPQMSVSNNQVTFHVNGVTDPKAVAAEVERMLNSLGLPNMGQLNRDQTRNGQTGVR